MKDVYEERERDRAIEERDAALAQVEGLRSAMEAARRELRACASQLASLGRTGHPNGSVARALAQADAALSSHPAPAAYTRERATALIIPICKAHGMTGCAACNGIPGAHNNVPGFPRCLLPTSE